MLVDHVWLSQSWPEWPVLKPPCPALIYMMYIIILPWYSSYISICLWYIAYFLSEFSWKVKRDLVIQPDALARWPSGRVPGLSGYGGYDVDPPLQIHPHHWKPLVCWRSRDHGPWWCFLGWNQTLVTSRPDSALKDPRPSLELNITEHSGSVQFIISQPTGYNKTTQFISDWRMVEKCWSCKQHDFGYIALLDPRCASIIQ